MSLKPVTMRDIASRSGVSAITVSRALRGDPLVNEETRLLVQTTAEELGYVHNRTATAFAKQGSKLIALVVPNVSNSVFAATIEGLNEVLASAGFSITIGYSGYSRQEEERLVRSLLGYGPEALILTGFTHTPTTEMLLRRAGIPIVQMWNYGIEPLDMSVGFSNRKAARSMTSYLVRRGHKVIGYAGGTQTDNDRTQAREQGYREAIEAAGLTPPEKWIMSMPMELSSGAELARRFAAAEDRPDAMFLASDIIASGFVLECKRLAIDVPGDVAIAGFDDTSIAAMMEPPLTTVRVPQREIGRVAGTMILDRLAGRAISEKACDLGFEIIIRSTA